MSNNKENHESNSSKIKTIKDLYISVNLYNNPLTALTKNPHLSPEEKQHHEMASYIKNIICLPGSGYLTGAIFGFSKGSFQGFRKPSVSVAPEMRQILIDRVLISGIETGIRYGGKLGVLGFMYASLEVGVMFFTNRYVPFDPFSTVVAGYGTGVLYKIFSSPRSRGTIACAGLVGALTAVVGKNVMKGKTL